MTSSRLPAAIIAAGTLLAGAVYLSMGGHLFPARAGGTISLIAPVTASDHILGNPAAPIMIVEYADFDCEYCKPFSDILHEVVAKDGAAGQVAWVYREFPLAALHPNALGEARAAECAAKTGGNGAFWSFADELFAAQPADPSTFGALAAKAGVPGDAFAACYADAANQVDALIDADLKNAQDMGLASTPFSVILAYGKVSNVIDGAYTYDAVKELVDMARRNAP